MSRPCGPAITIRFRIFISSNMSHLTNKRYLLLSHLIIGRIKVHILATFTGYPRKKIFPGWIQTWNVVKERSLGILINEKTKEAECGGWVDNSRLPLFPGPLF